MQQRQPAVVIAVVAVAVVVGAGLLFLFLNRGPDTSGLTGRTWQLAAITGETPAYQGVIPAQDYDYLYAAGAKAVFGPGTRIEDSAKKVLEEIRKARAAGH